MSTLFSLSFLPLPIYKVVQRGLAGFGVCFVTADVEIKIDDSLAAYESIVFANQLEPVFLCHEGERKTGGCNQ